MAFSTTDGDTLFGNAGSEAPLAHRVRPRVLADVVGQRHFLNERFEKLLASDRWSGMVFWGPPGTGKTTLASVIAGLTGRTFVSLSAVIAGVKEIREALEKSKKAVNSGLKAHIIFIDEVHRLNKAQQDVLLPYLEEGSARFIGATTENPSFEINNAIASRCLIFKFLPLREEDILELLKRVGEKKSFDPGVLEEIARASLGDARRALTLLDHLMLCSPDKETISISDFEELKHSQSLYYDKKSEGHYDTISAFIKSMRGSDPDAALYYLARMLEGGEDPVFIARRLVIFASEDVGNASPLGLVLANAAFQSVHAVGMPEARIMLAQATTFLACAEKSNRSYKGIDQAIEVVRKTGNLEIPMHIRNAPTQMMKKMGYGKDYQYPHDFGNAHVKENYLPKEIETLRFYVPSERGSEKKMAEFLKVRKGLQENPQS